MKINKFMALICLCLPLCGCSIYNEDTTFNLITEENEVKKAEAEHIWQIFDNDSDFGKLSKEQQQILDEEFNRVDNITFIQHSNGRNVQVYESKKMKGAYVMCDGEWISVLTPNWEQLEECDELYNKLEKTAFVPRKLNRGENGSGVIICYNREYTVMDLDFVTPFSVRYTDVDVQVENMPLTVLVYEKEGRVERIELVSISSPYMDKLSRGNIDDVKVLFDELGLGSESSELAGEFAQSLDKGSYTRKNGAVSVRSSRQVKREKDYVYNVFTVTME